MLNKKVSCPNFCIIAIVLVSAMAMFLGCNRDQKTMQQKYAESMKYAISVHDYYQAYQYAQNNDQRLLVLERMAEQLLTKDEWSSFLRIIGEDSYRFHAYHRLSDLYLYVLINNANFAPCWGAFQQVTDSLQTRHLPRIIQMATRFDEAQSIYEWAAARKQTELMSQAVSIMQRTADDLLEWMWLVQNLPPESPGWETAAEKLLSYQYGTSYFLKNYDDAEPHYLAFAKSHRQVMDWVAVTATLINRDDPLYRLAMRELQRPRSFVDLVSDYTEAISSQNTELQLLIADQIDSQPRSRKEWLDAIDVAPGTYLHMLAEQRLRETMARPLEHAETHLTTPGPSAIGFIELPQPARDGHSSDNNWGKIEPIYRATPADPVPPPASEFEGMSFGRIKNLYR